MKKRKNRANVPSNCTLIYYGIVSASHALHLLMSLVGSARIRHPSNYEIKLQKKIKKKAYNILRMEGVFMKPDSEWLTKIHIY